MFQKIITLGGGLTAFALAALRFYEFDRDRRPKLDTSVTLTSDEGFGNTIILLNSSKVPANIYNYSLAWVRPHFLHRYISSFRKVDHEEFPLGPHDNCNITVAAYSQYSLHFTDENHFEWGIQLKHNVYLKLWMIGRRRPLWLRITGPIEGVFIKGNKP